jgi:type I restriction enzyme S subunit
MKQHTENNLPEGWILTTIAEIADLNPPKPPQNALDPNTIVTFVPMPAVDAESGIISQPIDRRFSQVRKGYTAFREGDVIMAKITPCMENGKAAIVRSLKNGLGFGSTEFHVLRSNGSVLPEYLFHFIRQESFRKAAEAEMTGSVGQKRVPAEFLKQSEIPLPPLPEQKRIVAKVEELLARVNSARERLNKVSIILKRFRQAVLSAACSGHLTEDWRENNKEDSAQELVTKILNLRRSFLEINRKVGLRTRYKEPIEPAYELEFETPDTWCLSTVEQLTLLVTKGSSPQWQGFEYTDGGLPFIRSQNVLWGNLDLSDVAYLPPVFNESHKNSIIHQGDILLNLVGASVGRCTIATQAIEGANCNQAVAIIRLVPDGMLNKFLVYFLLSPYAQEHIHETKADVARANFNLDDIRPMVVPVPPLSEQHEIVRRVEAMFKLADTVEKRVETAKLRAEKLTQGILAKAFRGELVPTEAELARLEHRPYESASELLARIKAERESKESSQKVRRSRK